MANIYQTGTTTDTQALISLISTFLTSTLGWTLLQANSAELFNNINNDANTKYTRYYQSPLGTYFFLSTGIEGTTVDYRNYIIGGVLEGHTTSGVPPVYAYDDQAGYVRYFYSNDVAGPYTAYHFFGGQEGVDGNYFYCVLETEAGKFSHFGIGELDRIGNITGRFAVGLWWNMTVTYWRDVNSSNHQRMFDGSSTGGSQNAGGGHLSYHQLTVPPDPDNYRFGTSLNGVTGSGYRGLNGVLVDDSPNAFNGRTALLPAHVYLYDQGSPTNWYRLVGMAPAHRFLNIANHSPGDIIDTDWICFPIKAKNAVTGPTSGNYGWAYKFQ